MTLFNHSFTFNKLHWYVIMFFVNSHFNIIYTFLLILEVNSALFIFTYINNNKCCGSAVCFVN